MKRDIASVFGALAAFAVVFTATLAYSLNAIAHSIGAALRVAGL